MTYLMDTHILLWALFEPEKLSPTIRHILLAEENNIFISQVSVWEISLKYGLGKLIIGKLKPENLKEAFENSGYRIFQIKDSDLYDYYQLPKTAHKDPFDRLIIWQCIKNNHILLSRDKRVKEYGHYGLTFIE